MSNIVKTLPSFSWERSVWFFDVDDTLIDTAGMTIPAAEAVQEVFQNHVSVAQAEQLKNRFVEIFTILMKGHQGSLELQKERDNLLARITKAQPTVLEKYGHIKIWSREIFIKHAAEDLRIAVTPELIHEAADAYWISLSKSIQVLSGVTDLLNQIKEHNRPLYLITSSDARLKMKDDGTFTYSPEYSEGSKRERIEILRGKGIFYNGLSIGDPEDKPHLDFFEKGIRIAEKDLGVKIDMNDAIMIGDSYSGDLETPKEKMGFGLVILIDQKTKEAVWLDERQVVTPNLKEVAKLLP